MVRIGVLMTPVNVFIIDDSAIVRKILTEELSKHPLINVVGSAIDPYVARTKIAKLHIDVITLDIELPRMDGLTFLRYLMKSYPIPVVVVSSITDNKNAASIKALELGAVDIVPKPGGPFSVEEVIDQLCDKIFAANEIDHEKMVDLSERVKKAGLNHTERYLTRVDTTHKLIAVGASTGGTNAMEIVFKSFDTSFPPTVAVIHMPEKFTYAFAERLNDICPLHVKEAVNNEIIHPGTIYIAPGNFHTKVKAYGKEIVTKVVKGPHIHHQRPAVDVLFHSVAKYVGLNSIGILLTGMGRDGAEGLLNIKNNGGKTIAQDEKTSIVFGMPKEAINLGAVEYVLPIDKITRKVISLL
jgi:two-component system chemotaxis response regulator CheB